MKSRYMEERDHRIIGKELDLFTFSDLVGSGLPLWTPKGTVFRDELDNFIWEMRKAKGYERVTIPHITKRELYEKSGHWDKFAEDLFKITSRDGREYVMKPMNCPHHTQIFDRKPHSYREMPQRYAETTMVYRDEQSGELGGLTRVLSITQDDAHVFCRIEQAEEELQKIWDIVHTFYGAFGLTLRLRLSLRDPKTPEKYLGDQQFWDRAEAILKRVAAANKTEYFEALGEAAFYAPKLDFMAYNAAGREWQVATIQFDVNTPERFDLTCINEKGEKERIVMIHAAIAGSLERCAAMIIEHLGGAFPLWLSPVQARVLPIGEAHQAFAADVVAQLKAAGIRAELDASNESLGKKIRNAKEQKTPYVLVIGDAEVSANTASLESRDKGKVGALPVAEIVSKLQEEIKNRA